MVFESHVVDLLNKFAGQYLENLDSSQLRIGIWGGDVQLENLILKESALDDLDLPVKVLRGHLGKLVLKIPWKNLYSEPVVAQIDGLYLLVRPNTVVKYNEEKEEKAKKEKKQRQLEAIELARKLEEEKKKNVTQKDEKSDSFVEKLAMQIVKNLQVSVRNIHVRYEDSVTNPSSPFSVGVTLENLSAESTDANWVPSIVGSSVQLVHKLVKLDSLALYWNSNDYIGELPSQEEWLNQAKGGIATRTSNHYSPKDFEYVLQPISATTKVKLNIKPGSDLSIPKIFLSLVLQEISLALRRQQYHDVMELLESFDRMATNSVFRKYKPNVSLHGHAKQWWNYAITSTLEEDVRRKLRNWSWAHMKKHRDLCREYKELYKEKLLLDKPSDSLNKKLEDLENKLDVLNITICRRQAAYEEAAALRKKKKKAEEKKSGKWFSGWFGSSSKSKKEEQQQQQQQQEILTEEQKKEELEKLYSAIGYSEGEVITAFPKEYVENKVIVHLKQISVALRASVGDRQADVARLSFQDLLAELSQRPSAQAIKVTAKVDMMKMFGSAGSDGKMPLMMTSQDDKLDQHLALFNASFETNPLDGKCDQRAIVSSQPVKVIYDANTIEHVITFFQPPKDVHLSELSAAAYSRLEDLKSVSKASLSYAIEHHKITDVNVDVKSPFVIIPEGGTFKKSSDVLVVDLGHLKITSDPEQERIASTKDLSMEDLESKCYDKFDFRLEDLQILIAKSGDDWQAARKKVKTKMHILDPMGIDMKLQKALNPDDIRLAQIKLSGSLPSVKVHVSDDKLQQVIKLAKSIPIPGVEGAVDQTDAKPVDIHVDSRGYSASTRSDVRRLGVLETDTEEKVKEEEEEMFVTPPESLTTESNLEKTKLEAKEALAKQIKVSLDFEIEEIAVDVSTVNQTGEATPCLELSIKGLGTQVIMHPWDLTASASLGSMVVKEMTFGPGGAPLYLVQTPVGAELLSVKFVKVESDHPEYRSRFRSTQQLVDVEFSSLQVKLHQEALLNIIDLSTKMLPPSEESSASVAGDGTKTGVTDSSKASLVALKKTKRKKEDEEEIQIEVTAKLGGIALTVTSVEGDLSHIIVGGLSAYCVVKSNRAEVTARMKDLSVMDSTPGAFYPKIVSIVNQEVFSLEVTAYNDATSGSNIRNMEATDVKFKMGIGCIRVVFLNKFVMRLLDFLNKFQRAKDAMEYARKSAAESATATIQSLQTQSSRISLSVSIQAPLIVIPVSSTSYDALVANLGHLSVSNSFNLVHEGDDPGGSDAVIVDNMVVELSSVQLLRAVMTDGETIGSTRLVLMPASLAVYLARNLSPWYHEVPDIDVMGKLHAVKLCAGEDDIRTIMGILFQNLSEGVTSSATESPSLEASVAPTVQEGLVLEGADGSESVDGTSPTDSEEVWIKVKFAFEIEEVSASVFWKESTKPSDEKSSREPDCCLGQFSLVHVATSGHIKSNSVINASVVLQSCTLDDKRPESEEGVTRMIERSDDGSNEVKNMVDILFQQATNQDKTIEMQVQSFHAIVNLEYLLVLANVFTSALSSETKNTPATAIQQSSQAATKQISATVKAVDEEPPQITVQITIKDPEIVLLADAKDKDTNALFLKNAIDFHFVQGHGQQKIAGSVSDLVISSAAFDKERRKATKSRVLQLSHISLLGSVPEGSNMKIDVSTGMAYVHVSPPTIKTLTACLMSLAPAKSEEDETKSTEDVLELWSEKPITTEDRWYLSPVPEGHLVPGRRVLARSATNIYSYDAGFVFTSRETLRVFIVDSPISMCYDSNDIAAIVIDKDPEPDDLVIGTVVVAKRPKETSFGEGTVVQTKEEDSQRLYLVSFWDGVEHWNTLEKIRILPTTMPGVPKGEIAVASIVFVRSKDDFYRKGFVSSKTYSKLQVRIYDGDLETVDINDSAAVVPDVTPDPSFLKIGTTVIATFDGFSWEAGNIAEIKHVKTENNLYRVRFISGGDTWVFGMNKIRILSTRNPKVPEGVLGVGTVVWAHTSKIRYYKGFVSYKGTKLHVDLYEGGKFLYELKDASRKVIPDVPPRAAYIKRGTRVIAKFKNKPCYYSSTVMEVDSSDPTEPRYHVKLDDGDETWDSLYHLRLPPKEVKVGGEEKSADDIDVNATGSDKAELLVFEMEGFDVKLEGMFGGQVIPLLSVDGSIQGEVRNWSSALSVRAGMGLIGNYFNEGVSEWEPLIEPVEEDKQVYRHWELNFEFSMANGGSNDTSLEGNTEAAMTLAVKSKDVLEMTVTKTCLDVFTKLGTAFKEAVSLQGTGEVALEDIPPYKIWNELGMEIKIRPGNIFESPASLSADGMVAVAPGQSLSLRLGKGVDKRSSRIIRGSSASGLGPSIGIEVQGFHELKTISVKQARIVLHNIIPKKLISGLIASVVIQVETGEGQKIVTVRSPLQISNHFPIPMDLLCQKDAQFSRITTVQPDSVYSVPLILAHKAGLYLTPAGFGYGESTTPLLWNKLASAKHLSFQCPSPVRDGPPFHIEVDCEQVSYASVHGSLEHAPNYIFHIYPPAILHNYLPYDIRYASQGLPLVELKGGAKWPLFSVNMDRKVILHIQLDDYQHSKWRGQIELWKGMDELTTFTLQSTQETAYGKFLDLGVFATFDGTLNVTLYSPYWMVNKTDLYLEYMASDGGNAIPHPTSLTEPVMFSYRGKNTARVRLAGGEWSDKFSLDAVGSGGLLKVKKAGKLHELGMQITLSYFSLTKIVEFIPFNLINNATEFPVSLTDSPDQDNPSWITVQPGECVPFWPAVCPSKNLRVRVGDSCEVSPSFDFEPDVTALLRMNGKVGVLCADMLTKDSAAIITITPYYTGAAPVRLENCTKLEICYKQEGCKEHCLHSNQCVLYTWDEPSATKEFVWFVKGSENFIKTDLSKAGQNEFEQDGKTYYWSTFLDGLQRVLLFIDDFTLAFRAQVEQKERDSLRITLDLHGVGLSLVNNEKSIEVAYIGIKPSDVIWEEQKKNGRWKALKMRLSDELEAAWTNIQHGLAVGASPDYTFKSGDLEADFHLMEIIRPSRQPIRRTFTPGVSLEYAASPNELEFFARVNSVQIDSQVPSATFQTVLYPVPPPKSLAAENAPKPYIEMSLRTKQEEHSHVLEIKYFKVLIQEMDVKVDMGFLMALMGLFSSDAIDRSQEASQYSLDKKRVHDKLGDAFAGQAALSDGRNFFDYFHLSPLKVHVSFSQLGGAAAGDDQTQTPIGNSFLSLLLKSVGVAVTEVQDVEFKLAYFEIKDKVYTQQQLIQVAVKHYTSQALKQMYVLVLGLDVLGNPFGLITGLKEGAIDFFYEPYQGLIQGPGEFAEGLAIGARSLFGHTVGGAAGAFSRITGTLGKGIAALTMDDKYQQERRQAMGKKPVNVKEGLTRGGKGLLEGVVGGVTGIVTKPMEGAKKDGAAGFFKGLGKGVVGVLARPAGGIVDFASSTLEGIKGSASTGSEVRRLRPPRCFYADKVIKPYNAYEAQGNAVLQEVKKTEAVLVDDTYFCHSRLNIKKTLIITNKHIIVAGKTEVFETWESDWLCQLNELAEDPKTDGQKLVLVVPDRAKKGIFKRSASAVRTILTPRPDVAKWLVGKIKEARS